MRVVSWQWFVEQVFLECLESESREEEMNGGARKGQSSEQAVLHGHKAAAAQSCQ